MIILHASDLHFGRKHDPAAGAALLEHIKCSEYDLLVLSGDFTQRAKVVEYEQARTFIDQLPERPTVVTPGNHDIPLYRVFERAFAPVRNYKRYISEELNSVMHTPGATVVALDSTSPHATIVNGRLSAAQLDFARSAFSGAPEDDVRILVMHHALTPAPDWERDSVMRSADRLASAFVSMGVELVLAGHHHRAFVTSTGSAGPSTPVEPYAWVVHAGTASSVRGRGRERGRCTVNRIEIAEEHLVVRPHMYAAEASAFLPIRELRLPRRGRPFEGARGDGS